jgi:hypothetical protein
MSFQKNKEVVVISIAVIILGLLVVSAEQALAQELYVPPVGPGCEVDLATGGWRESTVVSPPTEPIIYGIEDEETDSNTNVNNGSALEEPSEPVVGSGGIIGSEQAPPVIKKQVTPPPKKTVAPQLIQPKKQTTAEVDSEAMLEAVMATYNKQHKDEVEKIKQYYNKPPLFKPATDAQYAQSYLDELRPIRVDVVNAKGDYEDALNKGASGSEIAKLKNSYDTKLQDFKIRLQDILAIDSGSPEALWQLGTLAKWEGSNAQSYENYRNALISQRSRNPFKYQQLLDSLNNPAIKIKLMQDLQPNENIIEIPTTKTSPFLAGLKNNLDTLVQPLTTAKKTVAKNIEKISRAFSFSEQIDKAVKTLGITQ